jgi:hypothetical protein
MLKKHTKKDIAMAGLAGASTKQCERCHATDML